ncbi:MAG: Potassium-transporting ATPase potassium-binding subunit [Burkholderia gladioli]|nr:MAG: Potassium-transporting ATPase potassium-binding subunit [Burkholderia gladioli]
MSANDLLQAGIFLVVLLALAVPVAGYLTRVMDGSSRIVRVFGPLERVLYRIAGVDPGAEMSWKQYAFATIAFNVLGMFVLYALLRVQQWLPGNPQQFPPMTVDGAFNTAISFVTNTNWQDYSPEQTVSYLTQMLGLTVQNFLSAATGIVVVIALIRGFARHTAKTIGNFWVDLTRVTLYVLVLVPMSVVVAALLMSQGVIQNFRAYNRRADAAGQHLPGAEARRAGQPGQGRQGQPGDGRHAAQDADAGDGPGGLSGSHQDARHQRRRLLQRQFGASVREPHAVLEHGADPLDPDPAGRAVSRVRPHDRRPPAGRRGARGDDGGVRGGGRRRGGLRAARQPAVHGAARRSGRERPAGGRQHGRQGNPLRHRANEHLRGRDDGGLVRRGGRARTIR